MHTQYMLQFCSQKSGDISIMLDTWSRASLGREGGGKHMQTFRATRPRLLFDHSHPPQRRSSHQFLTHVNGPLQYLMFLYGVLTIECRNGMHIWLLGRVRIHLPNRAMHSDVEREGVMKARANSAAKPAIFYPR